MKPLSTSIRKKREMYKYDMLSCEMKSVDNEIKSRDFDLQSGSCEAGENISISQCFALFFTAENT